MQFLQDAYCYLVISTLVFQCAQLDRDCQNLLGELVSFI